MNRCKRAESEPGGSLKLRNGHAEGPSSRAMTAPRRRGTTHAPCNQWGGYARAACPSLANHVGLARTCISVRCRVGDLLPAWRRRLPFATIAVALFVQFLGRKCVDKRRRNREVTRQVSHPGLRAAAASNNACRKPHKTSGTGRRLQLNPSLRRWQPRHSC